MKKIILLLLLAFAVSFSYSQSPVSGEKDVGKINCTQEHPEVVVAVIINNQSDIVDTVILRYSEKENSYGLTDQAKELFYQKDIYISPYINKYQQSLTTTNPTLNVKTMLLNQKIIAGTSGGLSY